MEDQSDIDPYLQKAYCEDVTFDMKNIKGNLKVVETSDVYHTPELSVKKNPMKEWELDVRPLISSKKWLQNYSLRKNRLDIESLLPVIGFKLSDDYDHVLKRPVASKYGTGMFSKIFHQDGKTFNITCNSDKLKQLENRLLQAIHLYKKRLEWLTTESRRMFGVVEEKCATVVLDIRNMSPQQFDQYRTALERVIREQVSQMSKFNLVRATEDIISYQEECVPVTHDTIESAIQWLWNLDRLAPMSNTAVCEAVMKAFSDNNNEAVYLYTEGNSMDCCRELMIGKIKSRETKLPLHIVSFNCTSSETIQYLKHLAVLSSGKFHAYAVVMEIDSYESMPVDTNTSRANILLKKKTYGGIPSGAGVREDVMLVFEELENARNSLAQIQSVMQLVPDPTTLTETVEEEKAPTERDEQYMSSKEWLDRYGLSKRKLQLYDILAGVAFKHRDGVVDILEKPSNEAIHTDAVQRTKLVNAMYCDKFPVVRWKNGEVVHVQVTPEIHRLYEQRMTVALNQIYQRLDWLKKGSRALFGTVVENNIYILIDTSDSMTPHLKFLKDKLYILMQEQLRHKMKFNIVAFNTKVVPWRDRLVEVNEGSLKSAWKWIQSLSAWGSTNTYAALQHALGDPKTEAVYLLTDGRPDQPPKSIIAQVQMQNRVPIHTISFNCSDTEANEFLTELSEATSGRFHYFSEGGIDGEEPHAWESEDVKILKDEIKRGFEDLDRMAELRDDCAKISWKQEVDKLKCSRNHALPIKGQPSAVPAMDTKDLYRPSPPTTPRPQSAPPDRHYPQPSSSPRHRPMSAIGYRTSSRSSLRKSSITLERTQNTRKSKNVHPTYHVGKSAKTVNVAGHTKTSLLRTLGNSGKFNPDDWLLPETRALFEKQAKKQRDLAQDDRKKDKLQRLRRKQYLEKNETSTKRWLKKYGLSARKLTILDVLAPTFVPHKAEYVPILDKHVLSKVFDEVLPLAHVGGKSSKQIQLINPQGVNLEAYEKTLQKAIDKYKRHLDSMVWKALPDSVKDEFDSKEPVSFHENKLKLMQALDDAGWPIQEKDILLMENEIAKGEKYLNQSQELRKAANTSDEECDLKQQTFLETSPDPNDESLISEEAMSQKKYEGLGEIMRNNGMETEGPPPTTKKKVKKVLDLLRGQTVVARNEENGFYYPGNVIRCINARHALVKFHDGSQQKVSTRQIIPTGGAVACPLLRLYDCVMVRVKNLDTGDECYVPAVIRGVPVRQSAQAKFYTVVMYNNQKAYSTRNYLIKIGKSRYTFATRYIKELEMQNTDRSEKTDSTQANDTVFDKPALSVVKEEEYSSDSGRSRSRSASSHSSRSKSRSRSRSASSSSRSRSRSRSRSHSSSSRSSERSRSRSNSKSPVRGSSKEKGKSQHRQVKGHNDSKTHVNAKKQKQKKGRVNFYEIGPNSRQSEKFQKDRQIKPKNERKFTRNSSPSDEEEREIDFRRIVGFDDEAHEKETKRNRSGKKDFKRDNSSSKGERKATRDSSPSDEEESGSDSRRIVGFDDETNEKENKRNRSRERDFERNNSSSKKERKATYDSRLSDEEERGSDSNRIVELDDEDGVEMQRKRNTIKKETRFVDEITKEYTSEEKQSWEKLQKMLFAQQKKQKAAQKKLKKKLGKMEKKILKKQTDLLEELLSRKREEEEQDKLNLEDEEQRSDSFLQNTEASSKENVLTIPVTPSIVKTRKVLPKVPVGDEVLARWSDEGWYYRGVILRDCGDYSYEVEDIGSDVERIWREDIISDIDDAENILVPKDAVVALHPCYSFSYAPGVVMNVSSEMWITVRFYDGEEATIPREEVYRISPEKFECDVRYIIKCENRWVGQVVVCRNDKTSNYELGTVSTRVGNGRQYSVGFYDGSHCIQHAIHMFGVYTKSHTLEVGDKVLAATDTVLLQYLPGWVTDISKKNITVKLCDGSSSVVQDEDHCFWLSDEYFDNALQYYRQVHEP